MIFPKKSNLLLAIRESIFLILLKFSRTEILVIFLPLYQTTLFLKFFVDFSCETLPIFLMKLLSMPKIHIIRGEGLREQPCRFSIWREGLLLLITKTIECAHCLICSLDTKIYIVGVIEIIRDP